MSFFRAASASIDVTPHRAVPLCGAGFPDQPFETVHDPLEWNAVLFDDGDQVKVFISGDFLSIGADIRNFIDEKLSPIPPENIICAASHNHFAPAIDPLIPVLGQRDDDYFSYCRTNLDTLLDELMSADRKQVLISSSTVKSDTAINRRRAVFGLQYRNTFPYPTYGYYRLPNEDGYIDKELHAIVVREADNDNNILSVIWSFACHPTCFPHDRQVSADFPGHVRKLLREKTGRETPILFLQGFCGNLRPRLYDRRTRLLSRIKRAIYGDVFGPASEPEWNDWLDQIGADVLLAYSDALKQTPISKPNFKAIRATLPISTLQDQMVKRPDLTVQHVQLHDDLSFFALSTEPMSEFVGWVKDIAEQKHVIPIGYLDHVFGYLPTSEIVKQGGYEAHEFRHNYSLPGSFRDDIDDILRPLFTKVLTESKIG
ncbi:MAG: hypothetical protein ACR2OX_04965 [Methyloligellaceae bacterium]